MKKYMIFWMLFLFLVCVELHASKSSNIFEFEKVDTEYQTAASTVGISANSTGDIAIGFEDKHINIYGKNGNFKYGYMFNLDGSYAFEFDSSNNIVILPARGYHSYSFSVDGELVETKKFSSSSENDRYYRGLLNNNHITFNDSSYVLKKSFFYTKLIKIDAAKNETIIYETGLTYIRTILFIIFIIILFITVIRAIAKSYDAEYKNK